MKRKTTRRYVSNTRQRQAEETRGRIVEAARRLLEKKGYAGMTIDAVAKKADVAPQTVFAIFRSKAGILAELMDRASFGPDYQDLVRQARDEETPSERLKFAARIARTIHEAQSATLDLLQGAGVVAPDLAAPENDRECRRYENQRHMITFLQDANALLPGLTFDHARDILWALTGRDLFRMLVRGRGWSPEQYETWLGGTLVSALLKDAKGGKPTKSKAPARSNVH
jgi:AcrR family transcriptional regulator